MRWKLSQFMNPAVVKKVGLPERSLRHLYSPALEAGTAMNDSMGYAYQVWTSLPFAGL